METLDFNYEYGIKSDIILSVAQDFYKEKKFPMPSSMIKLILRFKQKCLNSKLLKNIQIYNCLAAIFDFETKEFLGNYTNIVFADYLVKNSNTTLIKHRDYSLQQ